MCGRFTQRLSSSEFARIFEARDVVDGGGEAYNVAPTQAVTVLVDRHDVNRPGSDGDSGPWNQAALVTSSRRAKAASNSAGGMSPQAPWSRRWFHQSTHAAVASSTSATVRQLRLWRISSAL